MITAKNISYGYSSLTVYEDSSFYISKGEKVGLVGLNGAGKSTLFKLLIQEDKPMTGTLLIQGTVGHVPQEIKHDPEMEQADSIRSYIDPEYKKRDYELLVMITSLQIGDDLDMKPQGLSGGKRTKLALLKAIIAEPDILLLDEPTNFLDTQGKQWIMEFLGDYPETLIIISHDLPLLNKHIDKVIAINSQTKRIEVYKGDYNKYVQLKNLSDETLQRKFHNSQKEINRMKKSLTKMASGSTEKGARARANVQRRIDLVKESLPELPPEIRQIKLVLPDPIPISEMPICVKNISKSYGEEHILSDVSLTLRRGERVALLGPNGAGKSTFIKILMGLTTPDSGEIIKDPSLHIGYYSQEFETFDFSKTVIETAQQSCGLSVDKIRPFMSKFNFSSQRIHQTVGTLSGGEKTRLSIALLMLQNYNLLILDEPTTYLDVISQKVILEGLKSYKGTMLFVSHTEEFIEGLAPSRIMYLPENEIIHWSPDEEL